MLDHDRLTRRRFMGNAAVTVAGLGGASVLLSACGDDEAGSATAGSTSPQAASLTVVNILPPQLGYAAEYIADIDGHFEREGVKVSVETARGSAPAIQSVLSGKALLSRVGMLESLIHIANEGAPIVNVGQQTRLSPLAIVSSPENPLRTPQDLKGQTIGIPSEGGTSENTLNILVAKAGLTEDDVPRQVTGFSPGTYELIRNGRIDGFIIGATQIAQMEAAIPEAVFLRTADHVTDGEIYITSGRQLEDNKDTIAAYLRAVRAASNQIVDDEGFEDTLSKLRSRYDFDELKDDDVAKPWLEFLVEAWTVDGREEILKIAPEKWQDVYAEANQIGAIEEEIDPGESIVQVL